MIPMDLYDPFYKLTGYISSFYLNSFILLSSGIAIVLRKRKLNRNKEFSNVNIILLILIIWGIVLGVLNMSYNEELDTFTKNILNISIEEQLILTTLPLILLSLFFEIFHRIEIDAKMKKKLLIVFCFPIFLHLFANLLSLQGYTIFKVGTSVEEFGIRLSGIFQDKELIVDYCVLVFGLAFTLFGERKILPSSLVIASVIVGSMSGSRSFIVDITIFLITYWYLLSVKKRKYVIIVVIPLLFLSEYILNNILDNVIVLDRLNYSMSLILKQNNIEAAINRDFDGIPAVFSNISIMGNGAAAFNQIKGHQMVSHNLFLHAYARYGLLGLLMLLYAFYKGFSVTKRMINNKISGELKNEACVLFSLLLSLLAQQLKLSSLRALTSMLLYSVLFIFIILLKKNYDQTLSLSTSREVSNYDNM
jgi:hypothetical protein